MAMNVHQAKMLYKTVNNHNLFTPKRYKQLV